LKKRWPKKKPFLARRACSYILILDTLTSRFCRFFRACKKKDPHMMLFNDAMDCEAGVQWESHTHGAAEASWEITYDR